MLVPAPRLVAVRVEDHALLRRRPRLQPGAEYVGRSAPLQRRLAVAVDHGGVGDHREADAGMAPLQRLQRQDQSAALAGVSRKQLAADRQPLRRRQQREQHLDPVRLAVLAEALEPVAALRLGLELHRRRVVEDRGQGLRQQRLGHLPRPPADLLDQRIVDQVHAAADQVEIERRLAVALQLGDRRPLRLRLCDAGQHHLPDVAAGADAAGAEQPVPSELAVDLSQGLADADGDPGLLPALRQIDAERLRALPGQVGELPDGEHRGLPAVPEPDLLDDQAAEGLDPRRL